MKNPLKETPAPAVELEEPISPEIPRGATPMSHVRILLVDDHPLMRQGLRSLLEQDRRFEIVGEADNAPRAMELATKLRPNLAVVDISLRSTNGIELTKGLRAQVPTMAVLIMSMHDEDVYAERALRAGAMGYLMKREAVDKVVTAIDRIMQGEIFLGDRIKGMMLRRFVQHRADEVVSPMEKLSDREMEVFQLLGNGYGTREIADQLKLSVKTIDSYREHLKEKLSLTSGSDLVRHAIQWMKSQSM
ncbi:MAG TPA: response regulator transcription factor [Candidatus Didemnitutus sp.]|jgi:DNA-binding NarL/FixJ family response regulator